MDKTLEHYIHVHNDLLTAIEKEPAGEARANLKMIADRMHRELVLASNLVEDGKVERAHEVFDRIDLLFTFTNETAIEK